MLQNRLPFLIQFNELERLTFLRVDGYQITPIENLQHAQLPREFDNKWGIPSGCIRASDRFDPLTLLLTVHKVPAMLFSAFPEGLKLRSTWINIIQTSFAWVDNTATGAVPLSPIKERGIAGAGCGSWITMWIFPTIWFTSTSRPTSTPIPRIGNTVLKNCEIEIMTVYYPVWRIAKQKHFRRVIKDTWIVHYLEVVVTFLSFAVKEGDRWDNLRNIGVIVSQGVVIACVLNDLRISVQEDSDCFLETGYCDVWSFQWRWKNRVIKRYTIVHGFWIVYIAKVTESFHKYSRRPSGGLCSGCLRFPSGRLC